MSENRILNAVRKMEEVAGIGRKLGAGKGNLCNLYASPAHVIEVTNKGQYDRHSM